MLNQSHRVIVLFGGLLLSGTLGAQETENGHRTYFDNLNLDPDGHICYVEFLGGSDIDRIEYREEMHGTVSLYQQSEELFKYVETKDFNEDKRPDIITVEWTYGGTDIRRVTLYRGPAYEEHLARHLHHALVTATRHIIRNREEEKRRTSDIQARMDEIKKRSIEDAEVGVFTTRDGFRPIDHKDLRYAFEAATNLNGALSDIIAGDYKVLSQKTELTKAYKLDIDILLSLDPASYHNEP